MRYLIIIPAFNEEDTIEKVIKETKEYLQFADVLVVNDGSKDRTSKIAYDNGVMVITHPYNLGYGAAIQTGFRYAKQKEYDMVIIMDADGQHVPSAALNLIKTMQMEEADVVIGSRFLFGGYRVGLIKKIGIWLYSLIAKRYTGIPITDPTSGFQLLNRAAFSYLAEGDNYPLDYPDVNIIMMLHKKQFKIVESPVEMRQKNGKSMHSGLKPLVYIIKMFLAIIMVIVRK